jgi:tetratricopeptide (TPR) repeat protein
MAAGQLAGAADDADQALAVAVGLGETILASARHTRAVIATRAGDYPHAVQLLAQARAATLQSKWVDSEIHEQLGLALLLSGDADLSEPEYRRALRLQRALGERSKMGSSLLGLAAAAARHGLVERALVLRAAAVNLLGDASEPLGAQERDRVDDMYLQPLCHQVASEVQSVLESRGAEMTLEEAVEYALAEPEPGDSWSQPTSAPA